MQQALSRSPIVGASRLARLIAVFLWIDGAARASDALRIYRAAQNGIPVPNLMFNVYLNVILGLCFFGIGVLLWLEAPMYQAIKDLPKDEHV